VPYNLLFRSEVGDCVLGGLGFNHVSDLFHMLSSSNKVSPVVGVDVCCETSEGCHEIIRG